MEIIYIKLIFVITIITIITFIIVWTSFDQTCLINPGMNYKAYVIIQGKYIKMENNKIIVGKERFYIQPYQGVHFILSSNGQMLGLDIDREYKIVQNAITQNPIIIKDNQIYALDLTNKRLLNISDQIEIRFIIPKFSNNDIENHLRQYIYDLLSAGNFSEIPF
jgi:hypothetical protein